ncbi:MAG: bifunctional non-ous end joining protein LigD [Acidobacteriaceae bacterium]|nr:bifunctional non-ous end joining protein LigD [Acidobacteriaceae bacterium]
MKRKQTKSTKSIKSPRPARNIKPASMPPAKSGRPAPTTSKTLPITISNPTKIFWPDEGYTKLQLIEFYADIFPKLQPYVKDRILSLERCPDGMRGGCFYQKEAPSSMPPGTPTKRIAHLGKAAKSTNYVVGGSLTTQLALANLGCIAVHISGSRASSLRRPDWVCFDMDPQSGKFADAARAGLRLKEALDVLKLQSFPKTSGSRGLHVFIPIKPETAVDEVLSFAESLVARLAAQFPKELTFEHSIAARKQRVYLDPYRNGFGQTVVAPYSVRRRPKAPFSTPLSWPEVSPSLDPSDFNLGNYTKRLSVTDPWQDFFKNRQPLAAAINALKKI